MKTDQHCINAHAKVNAYKYGDVLEMTNAGTMKKATIKPLSKKEYVDLSSGEIKQFNRNELRIQSPDNLKKTFRKLRRMIIANFGPDDLWLTLTYRQIDKQPMADTDRVYHDYKAFWRKFIAKFGSSDYL